MNMKSINSLKNYTIINGGNMITKIYYTDGSTYIDDDKSVTIRTDNLDMQQAMQLAFDTKAEFDLDTKDVYVTRKAIYIFSKITSTKSLFDYYNDLSLHILNDIVNYPVFDMGTKCYPNGITLCFEQLLEKAYKCGYKIDNKTVEKIVRNFIANRLEVICNENDIGFKYIGFFKDIKKPLCDIQHQIFIDNEELYNSNIIEWIDVYYHEKSKEMVLTGYNQKGDEVFTKTINNTTKKQAEESYNNIYTGMESSDFYYDK